MCMEVKGHLSEVASFLPLCGSQVIRQFGQMALPLKASHSLCLKEHLNEAWINAVSETYQHLEHYSKLMFSDKI